METEETQICKSPFFEYFSDILNRFQTVPYEQFQKELKNWFLTTLKSQPLIKEPEYKSACPDLQTLLGLISRIYHEAELDEIKQNIHISSANEPN